MCLRAVTHRDCNRRTGEVELLAKVILLLVVAGNLQRRRIGPGSINRIIRSLLPVRIVSAVQPGCYRAVGELRCSFREAVQGLVKLVVNTVGIIVFIRQILRVARYRQNRTDTTDARSSTTSIQIIVVRDALELVKSSQLANDRADVAAAADRAIEEVVRDRTASVAPALLTARLTAEDTTDI